MSMGSQWGGIESHEKYVCVTRASDARMEPRKVEMCANIPVQQGHALGVGGYGISLPAQLIYSLWSNPINNYGK